MRKARLSSPVGMCLLVVALLVFGAAVAHANNGGTLLVAIANDPSGWDMDFTTGDEVGLSLAVNVDAYLFLHGVIESDDYFLVDTTVLEGPYLDGYEVSADGRTWTIRLKQGVAFPDGTPVTAHAFKWSKDRGFAAQANAAFVFRTIGVSSPDNIRVLDDYTLQITTDFFSPLTPYMLQIGSFFDNPSVLQRHATADDPWAFAWHARNPGGGGPYIVEQYLPGQAIALVRNPNWPGEVANERVVLLVVPSAANRMAMLQRGDVDLAIGLGRRDIVPLRTNPNLKVLSIPSINQLYLTLNVEQPPFDDVKVRQALAYAIPYEAIVANVFFGDAERATSVLPRRMPGHIDTSTRYTNDLRKARQLLEESSYGPDLGLVLHIEGDKHEHELVALLIQDQLRQIGVNLAIQRLDATTMQEQRAKRSLGLQLEEGVMWVNDPEYLFSARFLPEGYLNHSNYNNPRVSQIVAEAAQTVDFEERLARYAEAQEILMQELPEIPIAEPNYVVAMRANVTGFLYGDDQLFRLWTLRK